MSGIRTVLFDLGNVLVDVDIDMFWRTLGFPDARAIAPQAAEIKTLAMRYEEGSVETARFLDGLQRILGDGYSSPQLRKAFESIIRLPIAGMEDLVAELGETYRTALVSNTNEIHHLASRAMVPALARLPKHYVSYELHALKPNRVFYDAVVRGEGTDAAAMIFIDDLPANVRGAEEAGMVGIRFEGMDQLRLQLRTLGVL